VLGEGPPHGLDILIEMVEIPAWLEDWLSIAEGFCTRDAVLSRYFSGEPSP